MAILNNDGDLRITSGQNAQKIRNQNQLNNARTKSGSPRAKGQRSLTPQDKQALPILTKKMTDKTAQDYGAWQEDRLVNHIYNRCILSDWERMSRIQRMKHIDIQLSGMVNTNKDAKAKKQERENKMGKPAKPIHNNLPLAYAQIDDLVTYCMSLYAPEMNIFVATSTADKQAVAEGLTREIGKHGQTLQYYRHFSKFILNSVKYNLGAMSCNWENYQGITFSNDASKGAQPGQLTKVRGTVWEGNVLKSLDMYNFLFDTSVHPCDLPLKGEFYAEVELKTPFQIRRMAAQKILFGIERYINSYAPIANTNNATFYRTPPVLHDGLIEGGRTTNWQQVLSAGGPAQSSQLAIELVWYTTWVIPSDFGLSSSTDLELWRIGMANGLYITAAYQIDCSHGQLPVACGSPIEDDLWNNQRSYAEMLIPLQHFASFLLNTHVEATRKAIFGITVFDKSCFPGLDLDTEDLIGARIPMKSTSAGIDIDKAFRHYNSAPQTDQNVDMISKIVDIMQKIMPTNQAQQVADLERATEYQAAATVQASSRRNLKIARIINDQAISPLRFQMMYNIYENINVIEYTDSSGKTQQITPSDLFGAGLEFDVGTGLKGMDRLMQISIFKDLMGYLFQVKGMDQQVDLLGLLSYVCQIAGFETDLSRFRLATPQQGAANLAQGQAGQDDPDSTGSGNLPANQNTPAQGAPAQAQTPVQQK